MTTRFTYEHLLELVEGDHELLARTLWRDLDVEWPGIEVALKLAAELRAARRRIAELEAALASR
jgi:hypothetical protein